MTQIAYSAFSPLRYLIDPAQPEKLSIPLGVVVEIVVGEQWMVGITARTALSDSEIAVMDGIGRELLRTPFELAKREVDAALIASKNPGDVLNALASKNIWSINVAPSREWHISSRQIKEPLEARIKEEMSKLWFQTVVESFSPKIKWSKGQTKRAKRPRMTQVKEPGRFFAQDNCWRVPSALAASPA